MGELNSVKVTISNRSYPLKITKEEEEKVMQAAQAINNKLKEFEDSYAVKDKQDLLAMCALQYATELLGNQKQDKKAGQNETAGQLDYLNLLIDEYLATEETPAP